MHHRVLLPLALATSAIATSTFLVARPELDAAGAVALVTVAFAGWAGALLAAREARHVRLVAFVIGAVLTVAIVVPPRGSRDLWGYVVYGRIVSEHGASPYDRVPAAFPDDPLLPRMGSGYRHTRSPYGPAFTAAAALATGVSGADPLPNRLVFQGLEAAAVAAALVLLWRRTRRVDALVWIGLNPLVVSAVVNDGHNDGLVMLCVLAAVLLAAARRHPAAGVVLAIAALVKLPALLALGGLAIWLSRRHGARAAASAVGAGLATLVAGYAVVGPDALASIGDSGQLVSRSTVWTPVHDLLAGAGRVGAADLLPGLALVGVVAVGALLAFAGAEDPDPSAGTAGAASSFALAGSYVLPGYATWGLAAFGTRRPTPLAWLVALQGAALLVAYELPHHADARANGLFVHRVVTDVVPALLLAGAVALAVHAHASRRAARAHLRFARG